MARAYTVATVALALETPIKWVDNVLSHYQVAGVLQKRQGISRKVSLEGVLQLALALLLINDLEIPTSTALQFATAINQTGQYRTDSGITIALDLSTIRAHVERHLAEAVEVAPVRRRGRPPHSQPYPSKTGRPD